MTHWVGVDDRRDTVVVDVTFAPHHTLDADDTLILCLVCQHWTVDAVTNGVDTAAFTEMRLIHIMHMYMYMYMHVQEYIYF